MSERAYDKLPREHQRVVDLYFKILDKPGSYHAIFPHITKRSAYTMSNQFFKKIEVIEAIDEKVAERSARVEVTQDDVLREVLHSAMMDPIDLYNDDGNLKPLSEIPAHVRRCISGLEVEVLYEGRGKDRKVVGHSKKIKLTSKDKMLELLGKHVGLFPNRLEHGGVGGGPIEMNTTVSAMLAVMGVDDLKMLRAMKQALDQKLRDQELLGQPALQLVGKKGNGNGG